MPSLGIKKEIAKVRRLKRAVLKSGGGWGRSMAFAGFELSPLSIWNEAYINLPISYAGATATNALSPGLFTPSLIFFYWLSNFAGLILLELGIETVLHKKRHLSKKLLLWDVFGSILVTALLIYLIHIHIIRPLF